MSEANDDYSDLLHDAMCWRELRKVQDDAAERIERPGADRLLICHETLQGLYQLIADDAERNLNRTFAALQQLPQPQREHPERDVRKIANRSPMVLTLVMAALAEGREHRWPHLFPEQKSPQGGQIDGEYAVERGYLAALLEWARQLGLFGTLTAPAKVITDEVNKLGGIAGRRIEGQEIINWRQQSRSKATGHNISKDTYHSVLDELLKRPHQPQTKADAISVLRDLVYACPGIDPRRLTDV
jgi:hypothetical protein